MTTDAPALSAVPGPTWRLVPSQFPPLDAFDQVADADDLAAVMELEGWTNDRLTTDRLALLPRSAWVFGRPNASVVMAAFLHGSPGGNRFTAPAPRLGAWYAALEPVTAIAEVAHHLRRHTVNEGRDSRQMTYRTYRATLGGGNYADVRGQIDSRPDLYDRYSFARSQAWGEAQRASGRDGILYDSLRLAGGQNVACFRPARVEDVAQEDHVEIRVFAEPTRRPVVIRRRSG